MKRLVAALGGFAGMEAVSYATHRWWMHNRGMAWHRSHHPPRGEGFEKNDLFPATFATGAIAAFALAATKPRLAWLRWPGLGITAYGSCYALVHEVFIHRRVDVKLPRLRYLRWLDASHRIHHLYGGEPYGMLLPVVPAELRERAATSTREPWPLRARTRDKRARL
jgi:beta-carotene 3-hydroxylase